MKKVTPTLVSLGFLLVLVVMSASAWIPYKSMETLLASEERVRHTNEVLLALDGVHIAIAETEASIRGYQLTHRGDNLYRARFSRRVLQERLQEVRELTADNPEQQLAIVALEQLISRKLSVMLRASNLKDNALESEDLADNLSFEVADALEEMPDGKRKRARVVAIDPALIEQSTFLMEQIREQLASMRHMEEQLLADRSLLVKVNTEASFRSFLLTILLNILIACALFYYVVKNFRQREEVETAATAQARILGSVLENMSDGVAVVDTQGRLTLHNPALEHMLGSGISRISPEAWQEQLEVTRADGVTPFEAGEFPLRQVLDGDNRSEAEMLLRRLGTRQPATIRISVRPMTSARGDTDGVVAVLTDVSASARAAQDNRLLNQKLTQGLEQLEKQNFEVSAINDMSSLLQSCNSVMETCRVLQKSLAKLFPAIEGAIYLIKASKDYLELVETWNIGNGTLVASFDTENCWCIKRGVPHLVNQPEADIVCNHLEQNGIHQFSASVCVPVMTNAEILGMLLLRITRSDTGKVGKLPDPAFLATIAEQAGLAISNQRLRESLRMQSNQDVLTGLFNRRFLDTVLPIELAQAQRLEQPMAVMMLDLDHFKKLNDQFGHAAGDDVLAKLGGLLRKLLRSSDLPCRYGGEEFALLLPGANEEIAMHCAERILEGVRKMTVLTGGQAIMNLSVSIGIALYPEHAEHSAELLKRADACLYEAKHSGRNRAVMAMSHGSSEPQ
ncbi:MAG: hypothetical protein CME36_08680 [unclassified Hahellaceae]|nr:hypothetical protein [Hahellaceae bacterium]|tara:strand:- start:34328 stop:36535 length:2208 start_codon:yes stop_codon:yes gene_type:complete